MQPEERQKRIAEHLYQAEFASLEDLSRILGTSVSTVRRDLDFLESNGLLKRTHGGARSTGEKSGGFALSAESTPQFSEKEAIGEACVALIQPRQTVIVDAGTTCFLVARHLEVKAPHIVTNSLPVALHFSGSNNLEVVVSGGVIYPKLGVLVGPMAVASFAQVQADVAILSCGGLTVEGVTNSHSLLIEIQLAMINAAQRVVLCVDHTKFGRQSITRLCGLEMIDTLITDRPPPADMRAALARAHVELIVTGGSSPCVPTGSTAPATTSSPTQVLRQPPGPTRPRLSRALTKPIPQAASKVISDSGPQKSAKPAPTEAIGLEEGKGYID